MPSKILKLVRFHKDKTSIEALEKSQVKKQSSTPEKNAFAQKMQTLKAECA